MTHLTIEQQSELIRDTAKAQNKTIDELLCQNSNLSMNTTAFQQLVTSIEEAGEIRRGVRTPSRHFIARPIVQLEEHPLLKRKVESSNLSGPIDG